ncbi:MAG TPA: 2-phosphosulfolactate phosphatase, partial [Jatrophihabitans sp.]|nr:2-phosphosulfolactate phosphatase [Jatrophihabitans sp.]
GLSLSPASIQAWAERRPAEIRTPAERGLAGGASRPPAIGRLILPSPNGSSICRTLAERGSPVLAGCLRNAATVADWLGHARAAGRVSAFAVIAAGEHWPDGSLRPAVEDLWGAGAVLARLRRALPELTFSPEAQAAIAAFAATEPQLPDSLRACADGRELIEDGFGQDVALAAELDADRVVPLLVDHRFRPA